MVGLGDTSCGIDPCGLWDMVYASDACVNYKLCVNPKDPTAILESQGLIAGTGTVMGNTTAAAASNAIDSLVTETNIDPFTGQITKGLNLTVIGIGALVLYFLTKR